MKKIEVYFDGGIRPFLAGGYARCYGWVIKTGGKTLKTGRGIEVFPDNVGSCAVEFEALARGLKETASIIEKTDEIVVMGDSRAVIDMCSGVGTPNAHVASLDLQRILILASNFASIQFSWIPREQNAEADQLGRQAYSDHSRKDERIELMNLLNIRARRKLGESYTNAVMRAWCAALTGKNKLSSMSVSELGKLLGCVRQIPAFASGYAGTPTAA